HAAHVVAGSVRGIEALAEGGVANQTVNLAYGEGNTLVRCAELIASELGGEPHATLARPRLGEEQHYGDARALRPRRGAPLRRGSRESTGPARLPAPRPARGGHRALGRLVPRAPRG